MNGYPNAIDLLASVTHFLRSALLPSLSDADAFNLRIGINAIDLVRREIAQRDAAEERERASLAALVGSESSLERMRRILCEKIASGEITLDQPSLRQHLRATTIDRLAIDQPTYSAYLAAIARSDENSSANNETQEE